VNEDKLIRALIRDGFLRQFQGWTGIGPPLSGLLAGRLIFGPPTQKRTDPILSTPPDSRQHFDVLDREQLMCVATRYSETL
jgi:hypothetical protein